MTHIIIHINRTYVYVCLNTILSVHLVHQSIDLFYVYNVNNLITWLRSWEGANDHVSREKVFPPPLQVIIQGDKKILFDSHTGIQWGGVGVLRPPPLIFSEGFDKKSFISLHSLLFPCTFFRSVFFFSIYFFKFFYSNLNFTSAFLHFLSRFLPLLIFGKRQK